MPPLKYDLTGQVFGLLTAIHHVGSGNWLVRCACGTEKVVMGQNLRNGVKSCGCANRGGKGQAGGAAHPRWKGDDIRYVTAHRRVEAQRGAASLHACIVCDEPATSWAYRGGSAKELSQEAGAGHRWKAPDGILRYSPDPADYDPLCWRCHARKDLAESKAREGLTESADPPILDPDVGFP